MNKKENLTKVGPVYLTQEQLAERWQVHKETIQRMRRRGELPFVIIGAGRLVRVPMDAVLKVEQEGAVEA
jgi:excisionase family DNA binding protein